MKLMISVIFLMMILTQSGCSIKSMAMNSLADALSAGNGPAYTSDNDPKFISEALPFGLKMMEVVLESTPEHTGLLTSAAAGFVQYGHGFILYPAATMEQTNYEYWSEENTRAKKMFLRAKDYGLRALASRHFAFEIQIYENPDKILMQMEKEDVPALYWTGAAWASALSVDKGDMSLVAELPIIEKMMERALVLDESWENGAIHEFFIVYDAGRTKAAGGGYAKAEEHFTRTMELNDCSTISPVVSVAESICIPQQDRQRFRILLDWAIKFDINKYPEKRLTNILAQQKAKRLLANIDLYFIE